MGACDREAYHVLALAIVPGLLVLDDIAIAQRVAISDRRHVAEQVFAAVRGLDEAKSTRVPAARFTLEPLLAAAPAAPAAARAAAALLAIARAAAAPAPTGAAARASAAAAAAAAAAPAARAALPAAPRARQSL